MNKLRALIRSIPVIAVIWALIRAVSQNAREISQRRWPYSK